jgi:hypothetical protein
MFDRLLRFTSIATLAVVIAACSTDAIASLLPLPTGPLVTVTTRGGECVNGQCGSTIVIERDGRIHQAAPAEADLGTVPPNALAALDTVVRTTNFDAIRVRKFTGECPTAFDGQEVIYEFGAPGSVERVASCETEIDPNHPLFAAVSLALQSVGPFPSPDDFSYGRPGREPRTSASAPSIDVYRKG